jgi:uncharacterized membrane protein YphA (DoxX/SURF4 family)
MLLPLAILAFLSSRLIHALDWLTTAGFQVPNLGGGDYRQPLYLPPLPAAAAIALAILTVVAGLLLSAGLFTRVCAVVFAACAVYLALADRLAAFTVSKLGSVAMVALACTPIGSRLSIDAWLRRRRDPAAKLPTHVPAGNIRFFQTLLVVMYLGSGICKLRGDWIDQPLVLWTHLHDSYQTAFTWAVARFTPGAVWAALRWVVLVFEVGAPVWFLVPATRPFALAVGFSLHVMIGLCFGPVLWFALLMMVLLLAGFAPARWLARLDRAGEPPDQRPPPAAPSRRAQKAPRSPKK